jgi:diguanylate cyclase (GGDEF)-like protein
MAESAVPDDPNPLKTVTLVSSVSPLTPSTNARGILSVIGGGEAGRVLSLAAGLSVSLGRSEKCTHRIDDASVSSLHARVVVVGKDYVLADERSTNGTFVNGARVSEPVVLRDGDRIQLGPNVLMRFALVDEHEEGALSRIYEAAHRDALTGAFNRKHFEERIEGELAYARRHGSQLSCVLLDVDHFKKVNDTYGHPAGDAVLKSTVITMSRSVRTEDVVARYGGEEFVLLVRDSSLRAAASIAERIRHTVSQSVVVFGGKEIRVTASAGVASVECCGDRRDRATLLGVADRRLYRAKQLGRNRVVSDG